MKHGHHIDVLDLYGGVPSRPAGFVERLPKTPGIYEFNHKGVLVDSVTGKPPCDQRGERRARAA